MKAVLIRTGSSPIHSSSSLITNSSHKVPMSYHNSVTGILFPGKKYMNSQRYNSLYLEIKETKISKKNILRNIIRRAYSDLTEIGSTSFPARTPPEEVEDEDLNGSAILKNTLLPEIKVYSGGEIGNKIGDEINGFSGNKNKIGINYLEMLKTDPGNSLLLRNYGKFLHEVEGDVVKAEEYYSRAILANPSDGEVLSLYGKLIWENERDEIRAQSYFDQAVQVAPNDCFVMGAYAHFLWDAEEEEENEDEVGKTTSAQSVLV